MNQKTTISSQEIILYNNPKNENLPMKTRLYSCDEYWIYHGLMYIAVYKKQNYSGKTYFL